MVLALIPARGGSKGVPGKNIKILAGKPLITYTIEAALATKQIDEIFVSTDDPKIASVASSLGIEVPFLRPPELGGDTVPMLSVIKHVSEYYSRQGKRPETIILLQPTCPFRTSQDIVEAIQIFNEGNFDSLVSVQEVPDKYNPSWVYVEEEAGNLRLFNGDAQPISRRQDLPKAYTREGSIYIFKTDTIESFGNIYGTKIGFYLLQRKTVNIDTMEDFQQAEQLMLAKTESN